MLPKCITGETGLREPKTQTSGVWMVQKLLAALATNRGSTKIPALKYKVKNTERVNMRHPPHCAGKRAEAASGAIRAER